ncbi:MAG: hypothetical protein C0623_08955 [Desulfuromonas sp.]|nr:MAG: hypothetical protein C0623_08955 [Desulfuromonas sp.]
MLDWEGVAEATGYNVYATSDGSTPTPEAAYLLAADVQPPFIHGDWQKDGQWVTGDGPLEGGFTYRYVVTARFGDTEGPCSNCVTCVLELPGSGIWRVEGLGNNLSVPILFSEGRGLSGLVVTETDTEYPIFENTGLRTPTVVKIDGEAVYTDPAMIFDDAVAGEITTQPLLFEDDLIPAFDMTTMSFTGEEAYAQGTDSIWQADWLDGVNETQYVNAKWGDNITGHQWTVNQDVLRVEVNLTQDITPDTMTGFDMISLFGGKYAEFMGATGAASEATSRVVYSPHARLQIEKMDHNSADPPATWDGIGVVGEPLHDHAVWENYFTADSESTFRFGAEINGAGSLTYGYVWMVKNDQVQPGWYRLTLRFDPVADCTTKIAPIVAAAVESEPEEELFTDPDIPVNTRLDTSPGQLAAEPDGEGPLFETLLVPDSHPDAPADAYMSVLHIYLAPGN